MVDPKIPEENQNVDFYSPEGGPGQDAASWTAPVHREQIPPGGSSETTASQPPKTSQKESEWPMGVRKSVEVNGKKWEYLEYGNPDGQPLLNVHGWLGSSAEGQDHLSRAFAGEPQDSQGLRNLEEYKDSDHPEIDYKNTADHIREEVGNLKGKYRIISPELPGFGRTEVLDSVSLDNMADALFEFQKAVGLDNSIAFGSSMGGILAIKLAARHPEQVRALVLQGTMTRPEDMDRIAYILAQIATLKPIEAVLRKLNISKKLFAGIVKGSKDYKIADTETQQRIISDTLSADSQTASATLREIGKDIEADIKKVECPVIVLDGANGDLVPIMNSARASTRFHPEVPNAEKVSEKKVVFLPVGGRAGKQGHNIINTLPEIALLVDDVVSNITK